MNPYLVEQLCRQRQMELLQEAQELRESYGFAPASGALLARLWTWARQLTAASPAPAAQGRGRQARRTEV